MTWLSVIPDLVSALHMLGPGPAALIGFAPVPSRCPPVRSDPCAARCDQHGGGDCSVHLPGQAAAGAVEPGRRARRACPVRAGTAAPGTTAKAQGKPGRTPPRGSHTLS